MNKMNPNTPQIKSGRTTDQYTGPLRAFLPMLAGALVSAGLDDATAGIVAGGLVFLASAAWSWWSNKPLSMAEELVKHDVEVKIGPDAPQELKEAALDPKIHGIVVRQ
jgi:hypothetical protein